MRFGNFLQRFRLMTRFAPPPAQRIVDEIPRDTAEPRAQFFRLAQPGQLFPRGDKRFLRQILALAQAARGAVSQRTDQRLIACDDLPEGVAVPGQAFAHQFGVVGSCD